MFPYFIYLFIIIVLSNLINKQNNNGFLKNPFIFLIFIFMILFMGLRDSSVGTDTHSYINIFTGNISNFYYINFNKDFEIGYILITNIASLFSKKYISLLITIAFFSVYFQIKSIYRLSYMPTISLFVLITLGFYTFTFNGARQGIAAAIYMFSIQYLIKKDFKMYFIWVIFAFLFHKTVIIALPLYFIFTKQFNYKYLLFLIFSTLIILFFFKQLIGLGTIISNKYKIYSEAEETGGKILTFFYIVLSTFFILFRQFINKTLLKQYDVYLNMFIIATIVYFLVLFSGSYVELTRIALYFLLGSVFIWPLIFLSVNNKNNKSVIFISFILIHVLFFLTYLNKIGGLTPYILNKEIFSFL